MVRFRPSLYSMPCRHILQSNWSHDCFRLQAMQSGQSLRSQRNPDPYVRSAFHLRHHDLQVWEGLWMITPLRLRLYLLLQCMCHRVCQRT